MAIANSNLRRYAEALDLYKQLVRRDKSPYFAYQVGYNQYQMRNFEESSATLQTVIQDTVAEHQSININMDQNRSQKVPLKAAAYNLLGVVQLEMDQNDKAKSNFEAALKLNPDFQLAKENLEIANKPKDPANKNNISL